MQRATRQKQVLPRLPPLSFLPEERAMEERFFLRVAVRAKVDELKNRHREVVLCLLEQAEEGREFNYSDIARQLGRRPHSIHELVGRAFSALSTSLRSDPEVNAWLVEHRLAAETDQAI
jgi:DNA-directed RNA polymerase specialized sigma24 family protein